MLKRLLDDDWTRRWDRPPMQRFSPVRAARVAFSEFVSTICSTVKVIEGF